MKAIIPQTLVDDETLPYTCWVIHATIEEKINKEIPFEIPCSVINSHNHTNIIEPIANTKPANTTVQKSVGIAAHPNILLIKYTDPIPWKKANGNVKYLVYWLILVRPTSHCSVNSSTEGRITHKSCIMIEAVMYGEIQIAMNANWSNAHHNNITKYPKSEVEFNVCDIKTEISANGTGMNTNNL
jgi:hypothetical protein